MLHVAEKNLKGLPASAWIYAAAVSVLAAAAVRLLAGTSEIQVGAAVGFGLLFLLSELLPISFPHTSYSVGFVVAVAALIAVGPTEAAIAASFAALDLGMRHRPDWLGRLIFNGAQFALATAVAGWLYVSLGGAVGSVAAADFPGLLVPLAAASAGFFITNSALVTVMVALARRLPIGEVWHENYRGVAGAVCSFAVLGLLLSLLYLEMGMMSVVFVLVPLLIARRALQAAAEMDAAYEATLRGLVTAIEAKDAYTRGHAERVSRLTAMIAREMGFAEGQVRSLRIAALLHDVGKLVVSTQILTKPGKLTAEEYEHMKSHPVHGCEVIEEIEFLRAGEAVNAVRHHHERMDGRGYPDGLFADEVPVTARIVMTADAFDSMTSTRTYRKALTVEAALRELRRCCTTQFDPQAVHALDRAIGKYGWKPTPELYVGEQTPRPAASLHAGL